MSEQVADPLSQLVMGSPPQSAQELRALMDGMSEMLNGDLPEVGAFHDAVLIREVKGVRVTADVLVPKGSGPHPVLVYLHGGGWVAGSPKTHNKLAHRFAEGGYLVFNVDYRLVQSIRSRPGSMTACTPLPGQPASRGSTAVIRGDWRSAATPPVAT